MHKYPDEHKKKTWRANIVNDECIAVNAAWDSGQHPISTAVVLTDLATEPKQTPYWKGVRHGALRQTTPHGRLLLRRGTGPMLLPSNIGCGQVARLFFFFFFWCDVVEMVILSSE